MLGGKCSQGAHFSEKETEAWRRNGPCSTRVELTGKAKLRAPCIVVGGGLASLSPFQLPINGGVLLTCLRPHPHGWPWRCRLTGGVPSSTPWGTGVEAGSAEERGSPWLGWGTRAVKVLRRERTWVRPSPQTLNRFPHLQTFASAVLPALYPRSLLHLILGPQDSRQTPFPCPSSALSQLIPQSAQSAAWSLSLSLILSCV